MEGGLLCRRCMSWPRPGRALFPPAPSVFFGLLWRTIRVPCGRPRKRHTRCEAGTQSHGPLLRRGGRAAERRIGGMFAARKKSIPIGALGFKTDRERLIRTKPVHELYGHLDRRQRGSEEDIARLTRWAGVKAWVGDRLVGFFKLCRTGSSRPTSKRRDL